MIDMTKLLEAIKNQNIPLDTSSVVKPMPVGMLNGATVDPQGAYFGADGPNNAKSLDQYGNPVSGAKNVPVSDLKPAPAVGHEGPANISSIPMQATTDVPMPATTDEAKSPPAEPDSITARQEVASAEPERLGPPDNAEPTQRETFLQRMGESLKNADYSNLGPSLTALGAGIAAGSGRGWGAGIGLGLAGAQRAQERKAALDATNMPAKAAYAALVAGGMPPSKALLLAYNPAAAKAAGMDASAPSVHQSGADALGNPVFSQWDEKSQKWVPMSGADSEGGVAAPVDANGKALAGEAFLDSSGLPDGTKASIRATARGDQDPPNTRTKPGQAFMALVNQYDPTYSTAIAATRTQTRKAFATGAPGMAVTALHTLPGHLDALARNVKSLGGADTSVGVFNRFSNSIANYWNAGGSSDKGKALSRISSDMSAVAEELERVWRGSGGNVTEIEDWKRKFNLSDGPSAKLSAIGELSGLVETRVGALKDQYARGMATDKYAVETGGLKIDPNQMMAPGDAEILDRLYKEVPDDAAAPKPGSPAPKGPAVGEILDGHKFKGGNPNDQNSWEVVQ